MTAKPYIIAEVGSNFTDLQSALTSVRIAKSCGADAVKFQMFNSRALYGREGVEVFGVPDSFLPPLKRKAAEFTIDFLCTAFSPELVAEVNPYVRMHKVASSDLCYPQLLQAVAATGKPILLSTGAKTEDEIDQALDCLGREACSRTTLLYCVAAYPARTVDLRVMKKLDRLECAGYGFSDHSTDIIQTPLAAAQAGAAVIEKHFTAFSDLQTPDRPHSLTPWEFALMVRHIRGKEEPKVGPTHEERPMLQRHNRRLVATRDIAYGARLEYGVNFGAYRSLFDDTRGMSPFDWQQAQGRSVLTTVTRGHPIIKGELSDDQPEPG